MSYTNHLQFRQRRHPVQRVTPQQAVDRLNSIVDEANAQIAKAMGMASHMEQVANDFASENEALRQRVAALEAKIVQLEKQLRKKAGKRKGAWLEEMGGDE